VIANESRDRAGHHRPSRARRSAVHRVQALLCLLPFLAQLVLAVVHTTCEPSRDTATSAAAAHVAPRPLPGPGDSPVLWQAAPAPHHGPHDPWQCPVCQGLAQVTHGLAPSGLERLLLDTDVACLLDAPGHRVHRACAAATPRAPPSRLSTLGHGRAKRFV
jgi:hypothetical protein